MNSRVITMTNEEMKTALMIIAGLFILLGLIASPLGIMMLIMVTALVAAYFLMLAAEKLPPENEKRKK